MTLLCTRDEESSAFKIDLLGYAPSLALVMRKSRAIRQIEQCIVFFPRSKAKWHYANLKIYG